MGTLGTQNYTNNTRYTSPKTRTQANKMQKDVDKEVAETHIKKLQKDPEFAKIIKFADIVAKNKNNSIINKCLDRKENKDTK